MGSVEPESAAQLQSTVKLIGQEEPKSKEDAVLLLKSVIADEGRAPVVPAQRPGGAGAIRRRPDSDGRRPSDRQRNTVSADADADQDDTPLPGHRIQGPAIKVFDPLVFNPSAGGTSQHAGSFQHVSAPDPSEGIHQTGFNPRLPDLLLMDQEEPKSTEDAALLLKSVIAEEGPSASENWGGPGNAEQLPPLPPLPEGVGQEAQFQDQIQSVTRQEQPIKVFNPGFPTVTGGGGSSGESDSTGQQSQGGHWKWVPPCGQQGGRPC